MDRELLAPYNDTRSVADKAIPSLCDAPPVNMFFESNPRSAGMLLELKIQPGNVLREH